MVSGNHFSTRVCEAQGLQENMAKNNEGFFINSKSLICIASKLKSSLKNRQQNGVTLDHDHPPFFTKNRPPIYFHLTDPSAKKRIKPHHTQHTHKTKPPLLFSRGIYSRLGHWQWKVCFTHLLQVNPHTWAIPRSRPGTEKTPTRR